MNDTKPQKSADAEHNSGKNNDLKPNASSQLESLRGSNENTGSMDSNLHNIGETNRGDDSSEKKIEVAAENENKPNMQLQSNVGVSDSTLTDPKLGELNSSANSGKISEIKSNETIKESSMESSTIVDAESTKSSTKANTTFINNFVIPTLEQNPRISGIEFFQELNKWDGETTIRK